jgi:hypothetical protein
VYNIHTENQGITKEVTKMKAHIQLGLLKLADPRVVRTVAVGLTLALTLLAGTGVVYANPAAGGGASGGG